MDTTNVRIAQIAACITVILLFWIFVYKFEFSRSNTQNPLTSKLDFDAYVRNASWWTEFWSGTPFAKGDSLEYLLVFNGSSGSTYAIDTSKICSILGNCQCSIDETTQECPTKITTKGNPLTLKITGKTKNSGTPDDSTVEKITVLEEKKMEEIAKTQSWEIVKISPQEFTLEQSKFSVNEDNLVVIHTTNDQASALIIWEQRFPTIKKDSGILYAQIPKHSFNESTQFAGLVFSNNEIQAYSWGISFYGTKSDTYAKKVTPQKVAAWKKTTVVLQGYGLSKTMSLQLWNGFVFKWANFKVIDDKVLSVEIPEDLPQGRYTFNIMDTKGVFEMPNAIIEVQ